MNPDIHHPPTTMLVRRDSMMNDLSGRPVHEIDGSAGTGELQTYFNVVVDHLLLILSVALIVGAAGLLYAFGSQSVYESNMTLLIEETSPNATKNVLSEASSLFETKKSTVAEMELLRSRTVIGPVVDTLRLSVHVQPKYFPLVGAALASLSDGELARPGIFGYGGYAWGAERAQVSSFNAQGALQQRTFVITATGDTTYRLSDTRDRFAWHGRVGVPLRGKLGGLDLEVQVARLEALPGAQFLLRSVSKQGLIAGIQRSLQIAEQGKQSGLIEVRLQGESAGQVQAVLDETAREYLRQSGARRLANAEQSLKFLDAQLVTLRAQLDKSDAHYSQFRHRHGTVSLADEARVGVEQAAAAKARRAELQQRKTDLQTRYGERHPLLLAVNDQLQQMERAAGADEEAIRVLPALEQDELKIIRDNKVKSELYAALSNTAEQLRILSASKTNTVRLVDPPTLPEAPVKPNRPLIVGAAVLLGLFLGMAAAFLKRAVCAGIEGPKAIKKLVGGRVVQVTIPRSSYQQVLMKQAGRGSGAIPMLARVAPEDPAIEALRGFRAALQFSMPRFRNNIVMITAPTARLGKSFVAANGATVLAASGQRVLLIDADLRAGHLHRYFGNHRSGTEPSPGLCEALGGAAALDTVIRRGVMKNLDFIACGTWPHNMSELLTTAQFGTLLASVSQNYDVVLIDAPQVLGVADALTIGAHAGAVFLLARAGTTSADDLDESLKRLRQAGIAPEGILFNDVRLRRGASDYHYKAGKVRQPIDCAS